MRKRVVVLLVMAVMAVAMLAAAAPAFAVPEECPGGEMQPGQTQERARAPQSTPSEIKPGVGVRDDSGDEHDTSDDRTGRGEMCGGG